MADTKLIVQTHAGPVQGIKKTSLMGDNYFAFFKIPYAKPPIGELRFKDPQPADPWTEPIDGTEQGPGCPGLNFGFKFYLDEDCLHVNVFTKKVCCALIALCLWRAFNGFSLCLQTVKAGETATSYGLDTWWCIYAWHKWW